MNISSLNKVAELYKATRPAGTQPTIATDVAERTALAVPTDTLEISLEARTRGLAEANSLAHYTKSGDVDKDADALATKISGVSSVTIPNFGNREFDAVSREYVAQTNSSGSVASRPDNFLSKDHRNQIKATLEAAEQENKTALFEFTKSVPHADVVSYIQAHAAQAGVKYAISDADNPIQR